MKKILAFAGSNSSDSINKQLATYASGLVKDAEVTILDLNDFELPMYSKDLEDENGIPENAKKFYNHIKNSDGLVISLAEYNGAYTSVFKNLFDWLSRNENMFFSKKPMLLMSTSPGGRGGASVSAMAHSRFPYHDANIVAEFSLPLFNDKFEGGKITDKEFDAKLKEAVELLQKQL